MKLDGTRGYQMQSECDGMHDGSPYKQVNPMQHYENTASERGSRVDGFNPEYGSPTIPTVETLREVMDEKDSGRSIRRYGIIMMAEDSI